MIEVRTPAELRPLVDEARSAGRRIGLVPTMGSLHEGHLSLIDRARAASDLVVLSVFVNPLQFGAGEDLESYPRDLDRDADAARDRGVNVLFAPGDAEMYPTGGPAVVVDAPRLSSRLCGEFRPGHFRGVLTIVAKLFHIVRPDVAVFGRKDFQQLVLVRRMVSDLDMPVTILAGSTVREADGLALSSRNAYLGPADRAAAPRLFQALRGAQTAFDEGQLDAAALADGARRYMEAGGRIRPQYVEIVQPDSLQPVTRVSPGDVMAVAALVGSTRLIDNHTFTAPA